ncbi:hypothetical protein RND81_13G057700 [Saponaria officinalis]|uniref:Non-specific lipid-transfer protein n=1 Tax=Saponaria officinalis TaxID=3572 RepID=A0AAW1GUL3_SAPOF
MSHHPIIYLAIIISLTSNNLRTIKCQSVSCDVVVQELSPCLSYLDEQAISPTQHCCQGVKVIWSNYGKSKGKRQAVCQCLESMLPYVGAIDGSLVTALPKQCGLSIKLPRVTNSFNCSQVS